MRGACLAGLCGLALAPAAGLGAPADGVAVVFVPGLGERAPRSTDPGGTALAPLFRQVRRAGWRAVQMPAADRPVTGGGGSGPADDTVLGTTGALEPNVAAAARFLRELRRRRGVDAVVLVGYSWGGLVARGVAGGAGPGAPRVAALVTLGSPHGGTPAAEACLRALAEPGASFAQSACRSLGLQPGAPALVSLTPEAMAAFGRRHRARGVPVHLVAGDAVRGAPVGLAGPPPSDGVVPVTSALDLGGTLRGVRTRLRVDAFHTRVAVLRWNRGVADAPAVRRALPGWIREAVGAPQKPSRPRVPRGPRG